MKKIIKLITISLLLISLCACKEEELKQDDSPITFFVGLGNNGAYYNKLKEEIKNNLDLDIEFIYQNPQDTSSALRQEFKNNDLPADIIAVASPTSEEYLKDSTLDLMAYTHLTDYFTYDKIASSTNSDGAIYQLPFTTRLIGITYNETLLNELGLELPKNYEDMLALKQKCDELGVMFAISGGAATGHGFNYLFHTMGSQWLSTLEGTEWLNKFLKGEADIAEFKEEAEYFKLWAENGLFGKLHDEDWNANKEYCSRRALFLFDITNAVYNYEGDIIDEYGNVIGQVNDHYKTIPWISKDGSSNCYTYYDNMYLSINKQLALKGEEEKLAKVIKILEFMTEKEVTDIFKNTYEDGYVAVKNFDIDETRGYSNFKESIEAGYLMPWYYSYFDEDSIVTVGALVNGYLKDGSVSFEEIMTSLEDCRDKYLNHETNHICDIEETLNYQNTAKLVGLGSIYAYQAKLDELKIKESVDLAIVPYVEELKDLVPFGYSGAVATKTYQGELVDVVIDTIIPAKAQKVQGIKILGKDLKELINTGFKEEESTYPYVVVGENKFEDDKEYLVVLAKAALNEDIYNKYVDNKQIILNGEDILETRIHEGISAFLKEKGTLKLHDLD